MRVRDTRQQLASLPAVPLRLASLDGYLKHADRQAGQIRRRVLEGEAIPHAEKVFSIFEPHTEWVNKGKAGVPVELGLKVCAVEDRHGFILHHHVMEKPPTIKSRCLSPNRPSSTFRRWLGLCWIFTSGKESIVFEGVTVNLMGAILVFILLL